jgi:taurine dioxygenase
MKTRLLNDWAIEVQNIDLKAVTEKEALDIAKMTISNMVVVVKNQKLTPDDEINFCKKIGNYQSTDNERAKHINVRDGVLRVTGQKNKHGEEGLFGHTSALDWHANQASNRDRKPLIWLYAKEGTKGSKTSWISMIEAYNKMPTILKEKIKDLQITLGYKVGSYSNSKFFKEHHHKDIPFNLVHTNDAGQTGLYFPFLQIFGMVGKTDEEFELLISELKEFVLEDRFRYDHLWEDGDIVLSEQWLSIHKRWHFDDMEKRVLHRIAFDYAKLL